jgi:hypothetical protein
MVNGAFNFCAHPRYFAFKRSDPRVQFIDRKRVDILLQQLRQRVIGPLGQKIIGVHRVKVDPSVALVNMG